MGKNLTLKRKQVDDKSMFANEEFEFLRKTLEENNPNLASNQKAIRDKMSEFQRDILELIENEPEDFENASAILLQGLNFLASYSGEAEFLLLDFGIEKEKIIILSAIESKHCAVFVADKETGSFYRSLTKAFSVCVNSNVLRYVFYTDTHKLLENITKGLVYGVVAFQLDSRSSIKERLCHDLGHMSGFNYKSSQKYVFPFCLDFTPPYQLPEIFNIMAQLQSGEYRPTCQTEDFSLKDILPNLVAQMYVPTQKVKVGIVDDISIEIEGMKIILDIWPNIDYFTILQDNDVMPYIPHNTDILLLDEGMDIAGTRIAEHLKSLKFPGLIASITSGTKPGFTSWHFGVKGLIVKNYETAKEFVLFINSLLHPN